MNVIRLITFIAFVSSLFACEDIIEKEIDEKTVKLLAPADNILTDINEITFWWESLSDVDHYNIQIVTPSFENAEKVIADSLIENSNIDFTLLPGKYEWRVKAINSISETDFSTASFEISQTQVDLSTSSVQLTSPKDNISTSNTEINFIWEAVNGAYTYNIQIVKGSFDLVEEQILAAEINELSVSVALGPGNYEWRVKAANLDSETSYSVRSFEITTN